MLLLRISKNIWLNLGLKIAYLYIDGKIYVGKGKIGDLEGVLKKFEKETFLFPTSNMLKKDVPDFLNSINLKWTRAVLYRTVVSDLSDLRNVYYDILVFFSHGHRRAFWSGSLNLNN